MWDLIVSVPDHCLSLYIVLNEFFMKIRIQIPIHKTIYFTANSLSLIDLVKRHFSYSINLKCTCLQTYFPEESSQDTADL